VRPRSRKRPRLGWRAAVRAVSRLYTRNALVCFVGDLAAVTAEWMYARRATLEAEQAIERTWSPARSAALDQAIAAREALAWSSRHGSA